jgi:HPt (histidine-containing phosphotransfer) domain-containing protein
VFDPALLDALPMVADGSDPGYGQELLDAFMSSVPASLTTLRQAAARGEAKTVLRLVHTLKSSSAAVGALALAARAEAAENELRDAPALPETLAAQLHMEFERLQNELEKRRVSTPAGAYSPC